MHNETKSCKSINTVFTFPHFITFQSRSSNNFPGILTWKCCILSVLQTEKSHGRNDFFLQSQQEKKKSCSRIQLPVLHIWRVKFSPNFWSTVNMICFFVFFCDKLALTVCQIRDEYLGLTKIIPLLTINSDQMFTSCWIKAAIQHDAATTMFNNEDGVFMVQPRPSKLLIMVFFLTLLDK